MTAPETAPDEIPYRPPPSKDIVITARGERATNNYLTVGGIALAGLAMGGLGLHYNLDARDASDAVSATLYVNPVVGESHGSGKTWTAADQALVDRANSSSTKAEVFYAIGGTAIVAAVVYYILTEPPEQRSVIHTHVDPVNHGAMLTSGLSF